MAYSNKIDNEKLKRMIVDGKFTDEIAKELGVVETSIRVAAKRLGLKLNCRRKHAGVAAPAPVRESAVDLTYKRFSPPLRGGVGEGEREGQVIPVTLRLTVEVNVRVSTAGI